MPGPDRRSGQQFADHHEGRADLLGRARGELKRAVTAPLGLSLLAGLMVAPARGRPLDALLHSLKQTAKQLGRSTARGVTVGLVALFVLAMALPSTKDAILERPDAEQLKMRLNAQLGEDRPRFRLRLEQSAEGSAYLVIRRNTWNRFHPEPFRPLVQATELEPGDLRSFRFPLNPAVKPLALGAGLIAFGFSLRRRRQLPAPAG